jgi:hypothetical protein
MASLILMGTRAIPYLLQAAQTTPGAEPPGQFGQHIRLEAVRHDNLPGLVVPLALFAMILGIVWLKRRHQQALLQARVEFHKQLLDKFASGKEFAEFLESKGSQRFLDELRSSMGEQTEDKALRYGIVVAMLGLSMFALTWEDKDFVIPGVILLAVGAGFIISFVISQRLSKSRMLSSQTGSGNSPGSQN